MKSVLIVGAGPAGLVAAKTLLHSFPPGTFTVKMLDRNARVGGMWAVEKGHRGGRITPDMRVNGSRFTINFSDFSWDSVDVDEDPVPMFPQAWQVGRYLQAYADKYIPDDVLQLESRVMSAERVKYSGCEKWKVEWNGPPEPGLPSPRKKRKKAPPTAEEIGYLLKSSGSTYQGFFDFLIVASGFYHTPRPFRLPVNDSGPQFRANQQHSSEFRVLGDLLGDEYKGKDGAIVVIGGGMSGVEAAAAAALQISDARHSPSASLQVKNRTVYHVVARSFYLLPRYFPSPSVGPDMFDTAPLFAPLDLRMYDMARRPKGPIVPMCGRVPPARAVMTHQYLQSVLGDSQDELGSSVLRCSGRDTTKPPFVAISDNYAEFVREGIIVPIRGRAEGLEVDKSGCIVRVVSGSKTKRIKHVLGVIHGTGFTPRNSVNWLDNNVRSAMACMENCHRLPLLLNHQCTCHDSVPTLGFVGFYEGPFWGVMEMQARLIAERWSATDDDHRVGLGSLPSQHRAPDMRSPTQSDVEIAEMQALRDAMMQKQADVPQLWMGDYVGVMEGFARELHIQRDDTAFQGEHSGPSVPSRYPWRGTNKEEINKTVRDLHCTLDRLTNGTLFVAPAVFRALQGKWKFSRNLTSRLPSFPCGTYGGTAYFHSRLPTNTAFEAEYLYIEDVQLEVDDGKSGRTLLQGTKQYVYRYSLPLDKISVWFVKPDGKSADYMFYEMSFTARTDDMEERNIGWLADGVHLCGQDSYKASFEFGFRGVGLKNFALKYNVEGPEKHYASDSLYERP